MSESKVHDNCSGGICSIGLPQYEGKEHSCDKHSKSGTEWTAPGEGATVGDLESAWSGTHPDVTAKQFWEALRARCVEGRPRIYRLDQATNLRLTGAPLTASDLANIAKCEVSR